MAKQMAREKRPEHLDTEDHVTERVLEAAAWAVQMELMEEGSYCRGLDAKMKELEGGTGTWMKLFLWIDENVESIS